MSESHLTSEEAMVPIRDAKGQLIAMAHPEDAPVIIHYVNTYGILVKALRVALKHLPDDTNLQVLRQIVEAENLGSEV